MRQGAGVLVGERRKSLPRPVRAFRRSPSEPLRAFNCTPGIAAEGRIRQRSPGAPLRHDWNLEEPGAGHDPRDRRNAAAHRASAVPLSQCAQPAEQGTRRLSGLSSKPAPFGCYQAVSPARQSRIPARPVLLDACGIGGTAGSTTPVGAMCARTGQGRDRLPSWPHPLWSSIQFATGYRSDRGSRRSCHNPVR